MPFPTDFVLEFVRDYLTAMQSFHALSYIANTSDLLSNYFIDFGNPLCYYNDVGIDITSYSWCMSLLILKAFKYLNNEYNYIRSTSVEMNLQ